MVQQSSRGACHPLQRTPSELQHLHRANNLEDDSEEQSIQCPCKPRFKPEQDKFHIDLRRTKEGYRHVGGYVVFSRQSPFQYV